MSNNITVRYKKLLLSFVLRTGMYIGKVDFNNMMSFIIGVNMAKYAETQSTDFLNMEKKLLEQKYQIPFLATGTPGQIKTFAKAKNLSHVEAFKKVLFEVLTENMDEEMLQVLKEVKYQQTILNYIQRNENVSYLLPDESQPWLKELFSDEEMNLIQDRIGR